jgi:DNA segregation ATPase FtsK/SpoIIIE, S-DNA-T family
MFGPWKQKITQLETQIANAKQEIAQAQAYAQALFKHGKDYAGRYNSFFQPTLTETANGVQSFLSSQPLALLGSWSESQWQNWQPQATIIEPIIRIGEQVEQRQRGGLNFSIPDFAPFIGSNQTIIIRSSNQSRDIGLALLQSLVVRTALMLPHQARYTLLDPAGNGAAFPMFRQLKEAQSVRELDSNDVSRDLEVVKKDIQRLNAYYLDAESESFEKLPEDLRINERFEFIFAADFPNKYDRRAIEALQSVGTTGPRTGKYLFIHYNQDIPLPRDMSMDEFQNAYYIDLNRNYTGGRTACELKFFPDAPPPPELQRNLFTKLREAKPPERKLDWDEIVGIPEREWWRHSAENIIDTPIGGSGSSGTLQVWFGESGEGRPCAHGMLGAMTGAGKSNLYHVLILGLATRYSPEELRLYLIDGKDGVEFQPYRHLPHAEVVSLHSSAQLSRSVLAELVEEKERRNAMFSKAGVVNLREYRRKGQPKGKLPRVLLIVDEYQELFEGDTDGVASNQLLQLASQGRSAGIHMLLASQRFGVPGMLYQTAIFGNVHLRMAMQMTDSDRQSLTEFGRRGKNLIMTCDLPGKIVVNDRAGDDGQGANHLGKVAYLEAKRREQLLQKLNTKASSQATDSLPLTVVFDGKAQPNLIENPQVSKILEQPRWLNAKEWQIFARQPVYEGGLNIPDWFAAENPQIMWLGQEFSVRGQAMMIVRRKLAENVLIIGSNNAARYGMLVGIIASLAVTIHPQQVQFSIFDRSMAETEWSEAMQNVCECVLRPAGCKVGFTRDRKNITHYLNYLLGELERRSQLDDDECLSVPAIFAVMTELDQVDEMRRVDDGYGLTDSPCGQQLYRLYREGPSLGIHLILSFSGIRPLTNVIDDRRGLVNFRHRIALQMSEDESFTFVRNRQASRLQIEGPIPISALYMDVENDKSVRFKPYSVESDIPLVEQLAQIGQVLKLRSQQV